MNMSGNQTIPQMQRLAMAQIYQKTLPDPTDPVGFGAHCGLSYGELKETQPSYCRWVIETAREGTADHRLVRLAGWLSNQAELVQKSKEMAANQMVSLLHQHLVLGFLLRLGRLLRPIFAREFLQAL